MPCARVCHGCVYVSAVVESRHRHRDQTLFGYLAGFFELIVTTLHRPYRCEDRMYVLPIRHIADEPFRAAISSVGGISA